MALFYHICHFEIVNENKGIFLLDDHICKCWNLNRALQYKSIEIHVFCSNFQDFSDLLLVTFK